MSLFFLAIIPMLAFCPKHKHSYDKAIRKIMGKTWWEYKICVKDTCYSPDDSLFFDGYFNDFKNHYKGYNGKDLICITPHPLSSYKTSDGTSIHVQCNDCIPLICFIDTSFNSNSYPIYWIGLGGMKKGEILFISDSEFVMSRQSMVRVDSINTMEVIFYHYYKSVHFDH